MVYTLYFDQSLKDFRIMNESKHKVLSLPATSRIIRNMYLRYDKQNHSFDPNVIFTAWDFFSWITTRMNLSNVRSLISFIQFDVDGWSCACFHGVKCDLSTGTNNFNYI